MSADARRLQELLLGWYRANARDLPWRRTRDPYRIWLSEVMLQQTRVDTVIPYYERFLAAFPTVRALAEAKEEDVLSLWSGLGYYRRARMLQAAARAMGEAHGFEVPTTKDELLTIGGIGPYTAGAVASIAFGEAVPLVDGNVARVLSRIFRIEEDVLSTAGQKKLWAKSAELVAAHDPGAWNQALMELGATVCTPRAPGCLFCPVASVCGARLGGDPESFPNKKKKKAPIPVKMAALVDEGANGEVLLLRRRANARFGGLWEPPTVELDRDDAPEEALTRVLGGKVRLAEERGEVVHVLSHRRLAVRVFRGRGPARLALAEGSVYEASARTVPTEKPLAELGRKLLAEGARTRVRSKR